MKLRSFAGLSAIVFSLCTRLFAQEVSLGRPVLRDPQPEVFRGANPETTGNGFESYPTIKRVPTPVTPGNAEMTYPRKVVSSSVYQSTPGKNILLAQEDAKALPSEGKPGLRDWPPAPNSDPGKGINSFPLGVATQAVPHTVTGAPGLVVSTPMEGVEGGIIQNYDGGYGGNCGDGCCGGMGFNCRNSLCGASRIWGSVDYLMMFSNPAHATPLVTTSTPGTPFANQAGVLGLPTTSSILQSGNTDFGALSGVRATLGFWIPQFGNTIGAEVSGFIIPQRTRNFNAASDAIGNPILARPFFDTVAGQESALIISTPALPTPQGNVMLQGAYQSVSTQQIYGMEGSAALNLGDMAYSKNILLFGGRYLDLHEQLTMTQSSYVPFNALAPGFSDIGAIFTDNFNTRTQFFGGQIGLRKIIDITDRFNVSATAKLALGVSHNRVNVGGSSTPFDSTGVGTTVNGGLYALQSNNGQRSKDRFGVLPEVDIKVNYLVTENLGIFVGYNFLYLNNVVRASDQVSHNIDPRNLPASFVFNAPGATANPSPTIRTSDFWLQGLTAGLNFKY